MRILLATLWVLATAGMARGSCPFVHTTVLDFLPGWESGRASQGDGNISVLNVAGGELSLKEIPPSASYLQPWTTTPPQLSGTYTGHDAAWGIGNAFVVPGLYNGSLGGQDSGSPLLGGALTGWGNAGTAPQAAEGVGLASTEGYLFAVGGMLNATTASAAVYSAPITGPGTHGAWTSVSALPAARGHAGVTALSGMLYCLGGTLNGTTPTNTVYLATIHADGSLGPWIAAATNLPATVMRNRAVSSGVGTTGGVNGRIFSVGGSTSSTTATASVYVAQVPATGIPILWTATSALLSARTSGLALIEKGHLFYIGGLPGLTAGAVPMTTVYVGKLSLGGGIQGPFVTTAALPVGLFGHSGVSSDGYLYVMGGSTGTFGAPTPVSTVYQSQADTFLNFSNVGMYTNRFDLGSDQPMNQLNWAMLSSGCPTAGQPAEVRLRYRWATSAGTYGGWSLWSTTPPVAIGATARYLEYQAHLQGDGNNADNRCVDYVELVCSTPVPTQTATRTVTLTPTRTHTRTISLTPTISLTRTITATRTESGTRTNTRTRTITRTASGTRTISLTPSVTSTRTISLTPSVTHTISETLTESLTPTETVTPTSTVTVTATATATVTEIFTDTPTPTPTLGVFVGPNPVSVGDVEFVVFQGLDFTKDSLRIFSVSGEFVAAPLVTGNPTPDPFGLGNVLNPNATALAWYGDETRWDLKNYKGILVSPGIYYYVVTRKETFGPRVQTRSWKGILIVTK